MANSNLTDGINPFTSGLFQNGFENDKTPLDEFNMNLIVSGIVRNKNRLDSLDTTNDKNLCMATLGTETIPKNINDNATAVDRHSLKKQLSTEKGRAEEAEKFINRAAFGSDSTPTDINDDDISKPHSLQKQLDTLNDIINVITGADITTLGESYADSNSKLREAITSLNDVITSLNSVDYLIVDGGNADDAQKEALANSDV